MVVELEKLDEGDTDLNPSPSLIAIPKLTSSIFLFYLECKIVC